MHGIIHTELAKFIKTKKGVQAWADILKAANLGDKVYLQISTYPDDETTGSIRMEIKIG